MKMTLVSHKNLIQVVHGKLFKIENGNTYGALN